MYKSGEIEKNTDFFLKKDERDGNTVFFGRFIGYDEDIMKFLNLYYNQVIKNGMYIFETIPNPSENNVNEFLAKVGSSEKITTDSVEKNISDWLYELSDFQKKTVCEVIKYIFAEMKTQNSNADILKNAYIKLMCWCHFLFLPILKEIGKDNIPKVLFEGNLTKYEMVMIRILSLSGCDVVYVDFNDETTYLKYDSKSAYSKAWYGRTRGIPTEHFTKSKGIFKEHFTSAIGIAEFEKKNNISNDTKQRNANNTGAMANTNQRNVNSAGVKININRENANNVNIMTNNQSNVSRVNINYVNKNTNNEKQDRILTNTWLSDDFLLDILKDNNARGNDACNKIYNMFVEYLGVDDKDQYNNRLVQLVKNMDLSKKKYEIIDNRITNPTTDEVNKLRRFEIRNKEQVISGLMVQINVSNIKVINEITQNAFVNVFTEEKEINISKIFNEGNKVLCWLNRHGKRLFENYNAQNIPCFIYFGNASKSEGIFLKILSKMPVDVVYISPFPKAEDGINFIGIDKIAKRLQLPNNIDIKSYPRVETKMKAATVAYNAERELDQMLYNDTGIYRNKQFISSKAVTLKTTYEEIAILWKEDSKYRPSFEIRDNVVSVPNIFAKVNGVKDRNSFKYIRDIKTLITENTIVIDKIPNIIYGSGQFTQYVKGFHSKGKLVPQNIRKHPKYPFDYLSEDIQENIINKIQELIDIKWIYNGEEDVTNRIIEVVLSIDKQTTRLIQQFDYTKSIPKILVFHNVETVMSLEDCIYLAFLNLVGFDIVIFSPSGYRDIEKYISPIAFEQYTIGEYVYDIENPNLKFQRNDENNIFNRLFMR